MVDKYTHHPPCSYWRLFWEFFCPPALERSAFPRILEEYFEFVESVPLIALYRPFQHVRTIQLVYDTIYRYLAIGRGLKMQVQAECSAHRNHRHVSVFRCS